MVLQGNVENQVGGQNNKGTRILEIVGEWRSLLRSRPIMTRRERLFETSRTNGISDGGYSEWETEIGIGLPEANCCGCEMSSEM